MKTDLYTKIILTVIAISSSSIALQAAISPAFAQANNFSFTRDGQLRVSICNPRGSSDGMVYCADILNGGQLRVTPQ